MFIALLLAGPMFFVTPPASAQNWSDCPEFDSGLALGDIATVSDADASPLLLRRSPSLTASVLARIPVNTELEILGGPRCNDGWGWWRVRYNDQSGWVGEVGPEGLYNLLPPADSGSCLRIEHVVEIGNRARVTPGLSNRIRSEPGLDSEQVGTARPGVIFRILDGPVCKDGYWWWQIRYRGITGWTAEGQEDEPWLERVS